MLHHNMIDCIYLLSFGLAIPPIKLSKFIAIVARDARVPDKVTRIKILVMVNQAQKEHKLSIKILYHNIFSCSQLDFE
jgi:hypothetical protein